MSVQIERSSVGYVWFIVNVDGCYVDSGIELSRAAARKAGMEALDNVSDDDAALWLV
jgi:hypothetical protein